jgi:hypothetical protein
MNMNNDFNTHTRLLSELATGISQACASRNSFLEIYMGQSMPLLQLALFKPILLETSAFFCFCLKGKELSERMCADFRELAVDLDVDPEVFLQARFQDYEAASDISSLFSEFCAFVASTKNNAANREVMEEHQTNSIGTMGLLAIQQSVAAMQKAASSSS